MSVNQRLAITIPTYNRADFLDFSLEVHIPIMQAHSIPIYISDNASTDHTKEVVEKWQQVYPYIYYHRNDENLGADKNFEIALKLPTSDYVWLLGDSMFLERKDFTCLYEKLLCSLSAVVINDNFRVKNVPTKIFSDHNKLLSEIGWHMTQMSSLIFSRYILEKNNYDKYYNTNFIQTGILFEGLSGLDGFEVLWLSDVNLKNIHIPRIKKNSWESKSFEIWLNDWLLFVFSLPKIYTVESKIKAIVDHNKKTNVFGLKNLIRLRRKGYFSLDKIRNNKYCLRMMFGSIWFYKLYIPLLVPFFLLKFYNRFK